jgi:hypothetical protein
VVGYKSTSLGCSVRSFPAAAADANGNLNPVSTLAAADIYASAQGTTGSLCSALQPPANVQFNMPYGAVVLPGDVVSFAFVSAAQWQPQVTTWVPGTTSATLLFKTASGALVKYSFQGESVYGPYEVAASGTFMAIPATASSTPTPPASNTSFATTVTVVGNSAPVAGNPPAIIVGEEPAIFTSYANSLTEWGFTPPYEPILSAGLNPQPFAYPSISWSVGSSLVTMSTSGSTSLQTTLKGGGTAGQTTVTATIGVPVNTTATLPVDVYPFLLIGCGYNTAGQGMTFNPDGTYSVATSAAQADLYGTQTPGALDCPYAGTFPLPSPAAQSTQPPATPGPTASPNGNPVILNIPGGGVFFPNGDDPTKGVPQGSPRGVYFTNVTVGMWQPAFTSLDPTTLSSLTKPCGVTTPCSTLPDSILLFKTRSGLYVKLLVSQSSAGFIAGYYQVAGPTGFAY